jgi:beta-glucosidase
VIEMPWEPGCEAILWTGLGGEAGAGAVLDLLTGKVTPGGKLSETFPMCYRDTPSYPYFQPERENAEYREGIYVGYRYFDCEEKPVRYPFGYGLSYTTFAYDGLQVDAEGVSLNVTNTGEYDGTEIVQLYVSLPGSRIPRPVKELKGFQKVFLRVGETKKIRIPLDDKAFRYWNTETNHWEIESGTYEILIGASAADIRLRGELTVTGTEKAQMKDSIGSDVMPREVFSGGEKTENGGKLKPNAPLSDLQYAPSGFWRWIGRQMERRLTQSLKNGKPDLNLLFQYNMPFRAMAKMTGGMVSLDMTDAMVMIVNGQGLRGTGRLIRGFFRNLWENRRYLRILKQQDKIQRGGFDGQN